MPAVRSVLVVGAGAAGTATAILLAERGISVDLVEVNSDKSHPVAVAGEPAVGDHLPDGAIGDSEVVGGFRKLCVATDNIRGWHCEISPFRWLYFGMP